MLNFQTYILTSRIDTGLSIRNLLHYMQVQKAPVLFQESSSLLSNAEPPDLLIAEARFYSDIAQYLERWNQARCIAIAADELEAAEALFVGAQHYVLHTDHPEWLPQVILDVMVQNKTASLKNVVRHLRIKEDVAPSLPGTWEGLTNKEAEILHLLKQGMHLREMARLTGTSYETIRTHMKKIYRKLGVNSAAEAILKGMAFKHK